MTEHLRSHAAYGDVQLVVFAQLAAQTRTARGLLGWSQDYLAKGCETHRSKFADLEVGKRERHEGTLTVLMIELARDGR